MSASAMLTKDDQIGGSENDADPGNDSEAIGRQTHGVMTDNVTPVRSKKGRKKERAKAKRRRGEAPSATDLENPGDKSEAAPASGGG